MPTTETATHTMTAIVRLSCNHTLRFSDQDIYPRDAKAGDSVECPKCPAKKSGGQPVRRVKHVTTTQVTVPVDDPAPMSCTEYVTGDPDGCARCGERADLHQGATVTVSLDALGPPTYEGNVDDMIPPTVLDPAPADQSYDMMAARDEWAALKAWRQAPGPQGPRPSTANLDAMNAAHAAGKPRTGRKPATKKATAPKRTRAAGIRFHVGDRAMPDSQNKLSSVAWQATTGLGVNGGRLNTTALVALLAEGGITDPENAAWSMDLANGVTIWSTV